MREILFEMELGGWFGFFGVFLAGLVGFWQGLLRKQSMCVHSGVAVPINPGAS